MASIESEGGFFKLPSVSREAGFSVIGGEKLRCTRGRGQVPTRPLAAFALNTSGCRRRLTGGEETGDLSRDASRPAQAHPKIENLPSFWRLQV